jgi:hypothetical protein
LITDKQLNILQVLHVNTHDVQQPVTLITGTTVRHRLDSIPIIALSMKGHIRTNERGEYHITPTASLGVPPPCMTRALVLDSIDMCIRCHLGLKVKV